MITQKYLNDLTYALIGCAIEVHKELGPGLLESVYHKCYLAEMSTKAFFLIVNLVFQSFIRENI